VYSDDDPQWNRETSTAGSKVLDLDLPKVDCAIQHFLIKQKVPPTMLLPSEEVKKMWEDDQKAIAQRQPGPFVADVILYGMDGVKLTHTSSNPTLPT